MMKRGGGLSGDICKDEALFDIFWKTCKKIIYGDDKYHEIWDLKLDEFSKKAESFRQEFSQFYSFLIRVPLVAALGEWVKEVSAGDLVGEKYVNRMIKLIEKKLIPLINDQGEDITLGEFKNLGHEGIFENIRCVKSWTPFEKEEHVQCYLHFSYALARSTMHFVSQGFDPDRHRTSHRLIKYEVFFDFVQQLAPRDALIAKLLYFGAPSIDEVLFLKINALNVAQSIIHFKEKEVKFPCHLIQDLMAYLERKTGLSTLVFTNVRGKEVERAHLNQSFARACQRMTTGSKITPGALLRLEHEQSRE